MERAIGGPNEYTFQACTSSQAYKPAVIVLMVVIACVFPYPYDETCPGVWCKWGGWLVAQELYNTTSALCKELVP